MVPRSSRPFAPLARAFDAKIDILPIEIIAESPRFYVSLQTRQPIAFARKCTWARDGGNGYFWFRLARLNKAIANRPQPWMAAYCRPTSVPAGRKAGWSKWRIWAMSVFGWIRDPAQKRLSRWFQFERKSPQFTLRVRLRLQRSWHDGPLAGALSTNLIS